MNECGEAMALAGAEERRDGGEANGLSEDDFLALAERYTTVPVAHRVQLTQTPMELYRACRGVPAFLFEGDATGPYAGRFAFIGIDPDRIFHQTAHGAEVRDGRGRLCKAVPGEGMRDLLRRHIQRGRVASYPGLPPFFGGAAGYFAHEAVEEMDDLFHHCPERTLPCSPYAKALWFSPRTVLAVDRVDRTLTVVRSVDIPELLGASGRRALYGRAVEDIRRVLARIEGAGSYAPVAPSPGAFRASRSREEFLRMVARGKELIAEGEVYQIVLSQRFDTPCAEDPLDLFAAMRCANPSPYMFLFEFPDLAVVGTSPEMLVRVRGRQAITRPLAGTKPRGRSVAEDLALEVQLRADDKECAEHVMLVDLARNDLARVSLPGSVVVTERMGVERYARVMHLVSQVEGVLRPECDALDALGATFPAGTLSGAPKIRALEHIAEIEGEPRGIYGGALGLLHFGGDLETCIAIRTLVLRRGELSLQVGAGIVADADPAAEYAETLHKGRALFEALGGVQKTVGEP